MPFKSLPRLYEFFYEILDATYVHDGVALLREGSVVEYFHLMAELECAEMAKTYYPGAVSVADACYRYLSRWQGSLIEKNSLTTDQLAALAELLSCLATFIQKWPKPPKVN